MNTDHLPEHAYLQGQRRAEVEAAIEREKVEAIHRQEGPKLYTFVPVLSGGTPLPDVHVVALGPKAAHKKACETLTAEQKDVLEYMDFVEVGEAPETFFARKVKELAAELPGVTYGYLGNYERWGDDRSLYIFLPHPDRVGTYQDSISLGLGRSVEQQLKSVREWDQRVEAARRQYHNGTKRV